MITRQHVALFAMALATRVNHDRELFQNELAERIPYAVLPDAIRAYIGQRQPSHFEVKPDGTDTSWMEFPSAEVLESLTKENVDELIRYHLAKGIPSCVIGEESSLEEFDKHNYGHRRFHDIRVHLIQDILLDQMLRKNLVDCSGRFEDKFVLRHNRGIVLDGKELRAQLALFEDLGFIHLCGKVYERTGITLDGYWFEKNVLAPLMEVYPKDLAENTFKYMRFSPELDERIRTHDFDLTDEEKSDCVLTDNLISMLDDLYSEAVWFTFREL